MFTHVQCCDIVPSLVSSFGESLDIGLYFAPQLPRSFDHFYGAGRGGEPPPPRGEGSPRGGAPIPGMNLKCLIQGALNTSMIAQQVTQVKTVCCRAILSRSSTSVSVHRPQVVLHSYHGDDGWVILTIGDWVKKTVLVPHCC